MCNDRCKPGNTETCELFTENNAPTMTEPTFGTTTTEIVPTHPCDGVPLGNRPHENDCTMFYRCLGGSGQLDNCPQGQYFNRDSRQCTNGECI